MHSFFFRELQLITVLLLIRNSYMSWGHMVHLSKTVCGIFHLRLRFVFIKFIFFSTKSMDSLTLKCHNSFQNKNNWKATQSFDPRPLTFQLQQEVWKFNDICMSWSSLKTALETNFLNLENRSFEYVTFSQYLKFLYLITYLFLFITYLFLFITYFFLWLN